MAAWLQRLAEHLGPVVPNVFLGTKNRSKQLSGDLITARNSDEFARSLQEASPPPERRPFKGETGVLLRLFVSLLSNPEV